MRSAAGDMSALNLPGLPSSCCRADSSFLRRVSSPRTHRTPHANMVSTMAEVSDPPALDTDGMAGRDAG
jgi:hypothetical protein